VARKTNDAEESVEHFRSGAALTAHWSITGTDLLVRVTDVLDLETVYTILPMENLIVSV